MNRIDPKDAIFVFGNRSGASTDHCLVYGFAGGDQLHAESVAALVAELTEKLSSVPRIHRRLSTVPADLDYPRWVAHSTPASRFVSAAVPDGRWSEMLRRVGDLVADPIDASESAWRAVVVDIVTDAPFTDRPVVVVALCFSHAFVDGRGATEIGRSVFGVVAGDAATQATDLRGSAMVDAARGAITLPYGLFRYFRTLRAELHGRKQQSGMATGPPLRSPTALNAAPGGDRSVSILVRPLPESRPSHVTVSAVALTAVSLALERYFGPTDLPTDLGAHVPIAVPDSVEWRGVNRVVTGSVDLHPGVADLLTRTHLIQQDLHAERDRVLDASALTQLRVLESAPAPLLRAMTALGRRVHPAKVLAHTTISSVNRGAAPLRLAGADCVFTSGFPSLTRQSSLKQGAFTVGSTVTIGVVWSPSTVPDGDRYVTLLGHAWDDVVAALSERSEAEAATPR